MLFGCTKKAIIEMIYLFVAILIVIFIIRYDINSKSKNKDLCYVIILILFIFVAGFRWRLGSDTPTYLAIYYHNTPKLNEFFNDVSITSPLWGFINSIVFTLGGRFFIVQLIQASFVNSLYFLYIRKHSKYIFSCVLIYYVWMYTNQNMEIMKAAMSIVVCLFGNDYIIEKKWAKGFLLYFVGCLFHITAIFMFINPFILFLRHNKPVFLFAFFAMAFVLSFLLHARLGDYAILMEMDGEIGNKIDTYANSEEYGAVDHNYNYFIYNIFPFFVYSFVSVFILLKMKSENIKFEPFLYLGLMYMVLMWNVHIFYRFVQFYRIYYVLFFVETLYILANKSYFLSRGLSLVRAVLLFIPIFYYMSLYNITRKEMYYPYSSVIGKSINKERELTFSGISHNMNNPTRPNTNEY